MLSATEFQKGYRELVASFPGAYVTEETESVWLKKFSNKDSRLFAITIDRLTENENFPCVGQALNLYKAIQQSESTRPSQKAFAIPDYILNMTDAECDADYELLTSFFEAYPYPDTPPGATQDELIAIESNYHDMMRRAGINPKEATNPKVGKRLFADLMNLWAVTAPGQKRGGWQESLKRYNRNQSQSDMKTIKQIARQAWI